MHLLSTEHSYVNITNLKCETCMQSRTTVSFPQHLVLQCGPCCIESSAGETNGLQFSICQTCLPFWQYLKEDFKTDML